MDTPSSTRFRSSSEIEFTFNDRTEPEWLVRGVIPSRGVSLLWGETHVGKTAVSLDIANAVVGHTAWLGQFAVPANGSVYYVATEGNVAKQLVGLKREKPPNAPKPSELFLLEEEAPQIGLEGQFLSYLEDVFERLFTYAGEAADGYSEEQRLRLVAQHGETAATAKGEWARGRDYWRDQSNRLSDLYDCGADKPKLIIIDNLSNTFPGRENDNDDQTDYRNALRAISRRFNAHVMVLHNPGKNGSDIRGGQSLEDGMDAVYHLTKRRDESRLFVTTKLRDHECPPPIRLQMQQVVWPLAGRALAAARVVGEAIFSTACVVLPVGEGGAGRADTSAKLESVTANAGVDHGAIDAELRALLAGDQTLSRNKIEIQVADKTGVSKSTVKARLDIVAPGRVWPKRPTAQQLTTAVTG